jgi:transcriptional regulator
MYIPKQYLEEEWAPQANLIKENPLATVITYTNENGLIANHYPFYLKIDESTGKKYLHAHIAKANNQIPSLKESDEILVIFKSDDSYITPSYYPSKKETHKFVPTWDFAAVHVYGKPTIVDDKIWVRKQLDDLTGQQESDRIDQWTVDEAPESYVNLLQKAIIGLKIEILRTESKFKFEQKMKDQDIDGVICGLKNDNKPKVSELVKLCNHRI